MKNAKPIKITVIAPKEKKNGKKRKMKKKRFQRIGGSVVSQKPPKYES